MEVMCPMGEFQKHLHYTSTEAQRRIYEQGIDLDLQLEKIVMVWVEEANKELDLPHIKEKMKNYRECEWWTELDRIVPILEHWFGKANAEGK